MLHYRYGFIGHFESYHERIIVLCCPHLSHRCVLPPCIFRVLMLFLLLGASLGLPMAQAKPTIDETTSHESTLPI